MQSVDKKYFLFNKGINTEAPLVAWPEGFSIDEQNFDLLSDGSRRRRQGIGKENGAIQDFFSASGSLSDLSDGTKHYRWRNVNNDDSLNLFVMQIGSSLHFWVDPKNGPLGIPLYAFDLLPYKVEYTDAQVDPPLTYTASDDDVKKMTVSLTEIDGHLICAGKHIEPIKIDLVDNEITGEVIKCVERDMFGIDDGVAVDVTPVELSDTHTYNLYSRGWPQVNIDAYFTDKAVYPSKNMLHFMGLRRQTETAFTDEDGIKVFSPDKLEAELFQNMSAPQGHIMRNVFNRRIGIGSLGQSDTIKTIGTVESVNLSNGIVTVSSQDAAHGVLVNDSIEVSGLKIKAKLAVLGSVKKLWIEGTFTVTEVTDANTFSFQVPTSIFKGATTYVAALETGQYTVGGLINVSFAGTEPSETRFTHCAGFSGRVFYGGCPDKRLSDRIYFSKIVETDSDLGKCYQEADPTSEYISDLIPTDGGSILIPNLGVLKAMLPYGKALLVFSSEGVWAIGPGEGGLFAATSYSVSKVSDQGCIASDSVILADNIPMYWSEGGIYALMQDGNSGFLTAQNMTQNVINGLYNSIRWQEKTRVKASYDATRKRVFWLYNHRLVNPPTGDAPRTAINSQYSTTVTPLGILDDTDTDRITYTSALVFDLRLGAWTRWSFSCEATRPVRDLIILPSMYSTDTTNGALRFVCQQEATTEIYLGELTDITYRDWGISTDAYLYTGPDSINEPERFKTAPYVHVFMRKEIPEAVVVEQSISGGTEISPYKIIDLVVAVRTPSIYMQPRWDWARELDSAKIPNYVQVYREPKPNPNSFGVIVTKNKIRGRGRNLFLAFKAGTDAPAWIDGWTIKYDAIVRI